MADLKMSSADELPEATSLWDKGIRGTCDVLAKCLGEKVFCLCL